MLKMTKIPYYPLTIFSLFGIMTYPDLKSFQVRRKLRNELLKSSPFLDPRQ